MSQKELVSDVKTLVSALHLPYKTIKLGRDLPEACLIDLFGTIVVGIDGKDYSQVLSFLYEKFKGYRTFFITTADNFTEKKDELIFDLMRSGYMRYIRIKYPNQFHMLLTTHNYGRKIIQKRLEVWQDLPRFQFLVAENKEALQQAESYILSVDASFYDYMPERVEKINSGG